MLLLPIRKLFLVLAWGRCSETCVEAYVQVSDQCVGIVATRNWYELQFYVTGRGRQKPDVVITNFWRWAHREKKQPEQQQP